MYSYKKRPIDDGNTFTVIGVDKIPHQEDGWVVHARCWDINVIMPPGIPRPDNMDPLERHYHTMTVSMHSKNLSEVEFIGMDVENDLGFPSYEQWKTAFSWFNGDIPYVLNRMDALYLDMWKKYD